MEYQFTSDNFNDEVVKSDIPVMVDFYADWCGPCRMMMPVVEKMAEKYDGKVKVGKVNTELQPELSAMFNVRSIPSFFFIKDGKVVDSAVGGMSEGNLSARIDSLIEA
ncbi:MAG: thioredoxin [Lachnospiraceae bacterium]|nr:thioredoxin [Lachnospiraceae bacterium]